HMDRIVKIQLSRFDALLADRGLELEVTPAAVTLLADRGFDPVYGARPLKRSLQKNLIDPLANELLASRFSPGDKIVADARGESIVFERRQASIPEEAA